MPSAPKVTDVNVGNDSVSIRWHKLNIDHYPKKLRYDVRLRDNESDWFVPNWRQTNRDNCCQIVIDNLYPYWSYAIKLRAKSKYIDDMEEADSSADAERMWSEPTIQYIRTEPVRPRRAPQVPLGAFYIDNTETQLRLYWEHVPPRDRNGPDFHYIISELEADNSSANSSAIM